MFLETLFPPIPSEVIMPVAGVAAAQGKLSFTLSVASGHDRIKPIIQRYGKWLTLHWDDVEKAHRWFDRHGIALVFLGRLIPTIRSIVSIPAGLLDMRFRNFVIASTIGTALWTAILA